MFELSDRVAEMTPVVRRMYRYTASIVVIWIVIMAIVALAALGSSAIVSLLAIGGLIAGAIALGLLRQTDRFFHQFARRHRGIHLLRDADPIVKVPEGRTGIERLARHLAASNPRVATLLKEEPGRLRYRVSVPAGRRTVPFDLMIDDAASTVGRWLGSDEDGFVILARSVPGPITLAELRAMETDVSESAPRLDGPVARVILLRPPSTGVPEDVYEYAVGHPIRIKYGLGTLEVHLEVIGENSDGTYDLVPQLLGVP